MLHVGYHAGMDVKDAYPLVVVADPAALRDWYVRHLGFSVGLDAGWFVFLVSPGARPFGVCFMREGLEHQLPQFRTRMQGDALVLTLEVDDVGEALREVEATGVAPDVSLRDEPWGQRHFMLRDPAGVWVDVVQPIDPDPSFLDQAAREQLAALNPPTG
jgi:catechol 2,3-dioxygenase-like lactoylglutathione lyase family enzyme